MLTLSNADLPKEVGHPKPQASLETIRRQKEKREDEEKKTIPPEAEPTATGSEDPAADAEMEAPAGAASEVEEAPEVTSDAEPGPGLNKTPRPRKHYSFTEATENLHHGLPTSCRQASSSPRCRRGLGKHRSDQERPLEAAGYEPSFGKAARAKAKEAAAFRDRKSSLMEELFGSGFAGRGGPAESKAASKALQLGPGKASASNAFGDSRATTVRSIQASPTEGKRKTVI